MSYHSSRVCFFAACLFALSGCEAVADWHRARPNEWDAAPSERVESTTPGTAAKAKKKKRTRKSRRSARAPSFRVQRGMGTWYGPGFNGRQTASGERFDMYAMTAAHRTLPFGTEVRVTNERNGESVVVRINDRGPFHEGRIIDLSKGAAKRIGLTRIGTGPVRVEVL